MSRTITIPVDIESAVADLNGIGAIITAKEWHRAAIVATYVTLAEGQGKAVDGKGESPLSFSKRGIIGLRDPKTIRRYVQIWDSTGYDRPEPGQQVTLPDVEWKSWVAEAEAEGEVTEGKKKVTDYVTAPRIAKAIKENPRIAEEVAKEVAKAAPKAAAKAVDEDEKAHEEYVEVQVEKAQKNLAPHRANPNDPATKAREARHATAMGVLDWLHKVHKAGVEIGEALRSWPSIEDDISAEGLREAMTSLTETEGNIAALKGYIQMHDKYATASTSA